VSSAATVAEDEIPPGAWRILALGVGAFVAVTLLISTPAYLIPTLHLERGLPLAQAGLLSAAPSIGMVLTLVAWGAVVDRTGERWVIAGGLALASLFAFGAAVAPGYVALGFLLMLAGAAAAGTNSAGGRIVVGWFPRPRRGLAMGIRQMAQPLGVAIAALVVPRLAAGVGLWAPLVLAGTATAVLAVICGIWLVNPPRPTAASLPATAATSSEVSSGPNPYRDDHFLERIHVLSVLLVVPQFTLSTFGLVWLITGLGWDPGAAGAVIAAAQVVGAFGRLAVGHLSDKVGSRVRVLRWVALSATAVMLALALCGALHWSAASALMLVFASAVSVADNGLSYTSVAEAAGPFWSGKALGLQNTGQFIAAAAVGPGIGALATAVGFPATFALVAIAPFAAFPLVPRRDEHWDDVQGSAIP
jgi:MFS family permease